MTGEDNEIIRQFSDPLEGFVHIAKGSPRKVAAAAVVDEHGISGYQILIINDQAFYLHLQPLGQRATDLLPRHTRFGATLYFRPDPYAQRGTCSQAIDPGPAALRVS